MIANSELMSLAMNFGWIDERRVAGCRGPHNDIDLDFLFSQGIRAMVRLADENESTMTKSLVEGHNFRDCFIPIKDFTAPTQNQIDQAIGFIRDALDHQMPVAVSCGAGYGRTGTILACYLVSTGYPVESAIQRLISIRPISEEILRVPGQQDAIRKYALRIQNKQRRK